MNSSPAANTLPPATPQGVTPDRTADGSPPCMDQQWARQESAMHCVRLAVQRWRTGYAAADTTLPSSQERWFAEVHGHFTAWLTAGGFAQDGAEVAEVPGRVGPALPEPAQDAAAHHQAAVQCSGGGAGDANENSGTKPPFPCPA